MLHNLSPFLGRLALRSHVLNPLGGPRCAATSGPGAGWRVWTGLPICSIQSSGDSNLAARQNYLGDGGFQKPSSQTGPTSIKLNLWGRDTGICAFSNSRLESTVQPSLRATDLRAPPETALGTVSFRITPACLLVPLTQQNLQVFQTFPINFFLTHFILQLRFHSTADTAFNSYVSHQENGLKLSAVCDLILFVQLGQSASFSQQSETSVPLQVFCRTSLDFFSRSKGMFWHCFLKDYRFLN